MRLRLTKVSRFLGAIWHARHTLPVLNAMPGISLYNQPVSVFKLVTFRSPTKSNVVVYTNLICRQVGPPSFVVSISSLVTNHVPSNCISRATYPSPTESNSPSQHSAWPAVKMRKYGGKRNKWQKINECLVQPFFGDFGKSMVGKGPLPAPCCNVKRKKKKREGEG